MNKDFANFWQLPDSFPESDYLVKNMYSAERTISSNLFKV